MAKRKKAALYVRCSTDRQSTDNQTLALHAAAERHGWEVVTVFDDNGVSGAKGRDGRPAFDRMLKAVARKEFDVLMAWSVDRLGRSLQDLVGTLDELQAKKVDLYLDRQGVDTTTPAGKALFQMLGVFAEFERSIIQERVIAGLERARARGKKLGAPDCFPLAAVSNFSIQPTLDATDFPRAPTSPAPGTNRLMRPGAISIMI